MAPDKIAPLTRVTLQIQAGRKPEAMDITDGLEECDFIYGLGPGGLTQFEYALFDKQPGDEVQLHIQTADMPQFFEHVQLPVMRMVGDIASFFLHVRIKSIQKAESRDVVKAMAAMTDCGCSCCGHEENLIGE